MKSASPAVLLLRLEHSEQSPRPEGAAHKLAHLQGLERRRLETATQVRRLHEALCFLRAYPDDAAVLDQVERMLDGFATRADLRRHRAALVDSGIAGTAIHFRFFWFTAAWLAERWPGALRIDWPEFANAKDLEPLLRLLVPYAEGAALDELYRSPRRWIERWRGPGETDAVFLVRRTAALAVDEFSREMLYERLDPPLRLLPAKGTPSRTQAHFPGSPVVFRRRPLDRSRPDLRRDVLRPPLAVRAATGREALRLIDAARASMVTRSRDLDSFEHADPRDVRIVECGAGLQFAAFGMRPERRGLLDCIYGYLTLQNGVPIGYVLTSALFGSALVAYNVFESFRGAEAAQTYGRVLAMVRALFGCDTFAVDPYQLGHHNPEGLASGAWWFYFKLGFRPVDPAVVRIASAEQAALRRDTAHRSSRATLQRLSAAHVYLHLGRQRDDVLGRVALAPMSLAISDLLRARFGADRERGLETCGRDAARRLGVRSEARWTPGERLAWKRWSPLVLALPGIERWSAPEKAQLVAVVRAKGGRREADFARQFDAHRRLRQAVLRLSRRLEAPLHTIQTAAGIELDAPRRPGATIGRR